MAPRPTISGYPDRAAIQGPSTINSQPSTIRVLFVCLGNICRSPMAEAVFGRLVKEAGLQDKIEGDSAGTGHWHVGERVHPGTHNVLAEHGIPYDGRARLIMREDLQRFDYIITMDEMNLRDVRELGPTKSTVAPLMRFAARRDVREVPDPFYLGGFEKYTSWSGKERRDFSRRSVGSTSSDRAAGLRSDGAA